MNAVLEHIMAIFAVAVMSPILFVLGLIIKVDSDGPVFFKQLRMGKGYSEFYIYKFRTMVVKEKKNNTFITCSGDTRVTRFGKLLRRTKLDELPQLINIIKGDMSFVGPRPEVQKYTDMFYEDFGEILSVKPGITDLSSMKYRHEEKILARRKNPEDYYINIHLPRKIDLAKEYIHQKSLLYDLKIILSTIKAVLSSK